MNVFRKSLKFLSFILSAVLVVMAGTVGAFAGTSATSDNSEIVGEFEPNVILIKFKSPTDVPGFEKQLAHEIEKVEKIGFVESLGVYVVRLDELEKNPNAVLNRFKNNKYIEYAEPNYIGTLDLTPNDPVYKSNCASFAKLINAEEGWQVGTKSGVKVAVVDSGFNKSADLPNIGGYNVLNNNTTVTDLLGHGSNVSGILGAIGDNKLGVAGIVWDSDIMSVKITDSMNITLANTVSAITWAADNGAKVINLSLSFSSDSTTLKNAVDYAYKKGCIIVAASGNESRTSVGFPAAYTNVLGVGGTTDGKTKYSTTNSGNGLDVLASYYWCTINHNGTYVQFGGTSAAAPQVSGLAALVWEIAPTLSNAEVMDLIRGNTNASGAKWDSKVGYGTIDMGKTLNAAKKAGESKPAVTTTSAAATTTATTTTAKSTTTKATTTTTAKSATTKSTTTAKVTTEAATSAVATAATFPTMSAATVPAMVKIQGLNYNFNGSGKAVSTVTHKDVVVDVERLMFLSVTSLDKNMTIDVEVKNRENGTIAYKGTYSAVNSDIGFEADAGVYDVNVTITAANGNSKYAIRLVAPEFFVLEENPVPLGLLAFGDSSDISGISKSDIMCGAAVAVMAIATIIVGVASVRKRRR